MRTAAELLWAWLGCSRLPLTEKLAYLGRIARYALSPRNKEILYLGQPFVFDNIKTPLVLLRYPQDVAVDLLGNLDGKIETVLDIGGNIGQFSVTLLHYLPQLSAIDVFEANPAVLSELERNLAPHPQAKVHPVGVGQTGERSLFYVPGASGMGSFSEGRAAHVGTSTARKAEVEVPVELTADVVARTGRQSYDLVKIDVEGAELEVLKVLSVTTRYFWIELSGRRFGGTCAPTSELYETIRSRFGEFDVLFQSRWTAASTCDVLLEIVKPVTSL